MQQVEMSEYRQVLEVCGFLLMQNLHIGQLI